MLDYLPQEEAKLSEWVDRFVTLAGTFISELPFKMGDLEKLHEPNVRLKNKQASLNDAMQRLFASKSCLMQEEPGGAVNSPTR